MPSISVIIPAFNAARYLGAAIESGLRQTRPPGEIIVVDDGSTDNTAQVARGFGDRIRYVRQGNAGPAAARNRAAQEAAGEWLAFLDADDEWLPQRLEIQLAQTEKHPQVLMWCGQTMGLEASGQRSETPNDIPLRFLTLKDFAVSNPVSTTTVLLRRTVFEQVGGFDKRFRGPEDYDLWMRVAALGNIGLIQLPLACYREESGSLSMDDRRFLPQVLAVLEKAYGKDGVLRGSGSYSHARAYQYFSCSWMAYQRGNVSHARSLLLQSLLFWPWSFRVQNKPRFMRFKLLYRYCHSSNRREEL